MDTSEFWTRITHWFKRGHAGVDGPAPRLGRDGLLEGVPEGESQPVAMPASGRVRRLSRQQLREQALARLEEGHQNLVSLMECIRHHLEAQERRGQVMARSLEEIGAHLSVISQSAVKEVEALGAIGAQVQATGERSRRIEESLSSWPQFAESQRSALTAVAEQILSERQALERIGDSIQGYGGNLSAVERSAGEAVSEIRSLNLASLRTEEQIAAMARRQTRWLILLFSATAAAAAVAAALLIIILVR